jgi:hypothetical protein
MAIKAPAAFLSSALLLVSAAAPFWEAKPPEKWTQEEVALILTNSPWGRDVGTPLFLASAKPAQEAEEQIRLRSARKGVEAPPAEDDYRSYLAEYPGKHLIIAVRVTRPEDLAIAKSTRDMEKESYLRVGKEKIKMVGHFPPTPSDPYLRILFPKRVDPGAKTLRFSLYLPGITQPFREVEFELKEMVYKGKPEY